MARTIKEIQADLQEQYMQSSVAETLYGLERDDYGVINTTFDAYFSKVAVERLLIYILAYCVNFFERLLDSAVADLTALVESQAPGRCDWYARKLKEFQYDADTPQILNERGEYDVVDESLRVVKHAVAVDDTKTAKILWLKVAGEENGLRTPLSSAEANSLEEYISKIKYAGVPTTLVNENGDTFDILEAKIYYDPIAGVDTVRTQCHDAIVEYIQNLPFNGEYSNMALVDALQALPVVKVVGVVRTHYSNSTSEGDIADKMTPDAGYFTPGSIDAGLNLIPYGQENDQDNL